MEYRHHLGRKRNTVVVAFNSTFPKIHIAILDIQNRMQLRRKTHSIIGQKQKCLSWGWAICPHEKINHLNRITLRIRRDKDGRLKRNPYRSGWVLVSPDLLPFKLLQQPVIISTQLRQHIAHISESNPCCCLRMHFAFCNARSWDDSNYIYVQ